MIDIQIIFMFKSQSIATADVSPETCSPKTAKCASHFLIQRVYSKYFFKDISQINKIVGYFYVMEKYVQLSLW